MFQEFPEDNKNDDFLNEFRQKIADQSASNFEEKRNELKRSKSVFIGAVSGVALAGIVGWFVLSPRYAVNNPAEIPVIRRPQTAIKVQPSEPGGMEILNQDKSVYDIIEKKSGNEPVVENLLPPPEEPKLPIIEANVAPVPIPEPVAEPAPVNVATAPVIEAANTIAEVQNIVAAKEVAEDKVISIKEASMEKITVVEPVVQPKDDAVKIVEKKPEISIEKPAEPKPSKWKLDENVVPAPKVAETKPLAITPDVLTVKEIPAGVWQVQLMSSQNKKAIEKAWDTMVKKYAVLKNQPHEIETADLDFDGVFYRLKTGAFRDKADADTLCRDIKALGGTCIVKKK